MKRKKPIFVFPMNWQVRNAIWSCLDLLSFLREPDPSLLNVNCINQITIQFISDQESDEVDIKLNPAQYRLCLDAVNTAIQYLDGADSIFFALDDPDALRICSEIKESGQLIKYIRSVIQADISYRQSEGYVFPPSLLP